MSALINCRENIVDDTEISVFLMDVKRGLILCEKK
jgi:hypothetical protein